MEGTEYSLEISFDVPYLLSETALVWGSGGLCRFMQANSLSQSGRKAWRSSEFCIAKCLGWWLPSNDQATPAFILLAITFLPPTGTESPQA